MLSAMARFLKELRRRQVYGVVAIYLAAAWVLVQVAESDAVHDMSRIDSGLVLLAAIIGFPIALVVGWFYDVTKQGVFRTPPAAADQSFQPRLGARDAGILGMLAIVWAGTVYVVYVPPSTDKSIALLPFEVRGHDPDSELFAASVREDLHGYLSRIKSLSVGELNPADLVDPSLPFDRIARQLNVAYLLDATIERIANRIQVSASLVDTKTSRTIWWQLYESELSTEALFQVRSDIAKSIAANLRIELTEQELTSLDERPTENLAAWEAYVQGKLQLRQRTADSIAVAIRHFEKAVLLDPDFALAHAELAIAVALLPDYAGSGEDEDKVKYHSNKALELDPNLPQAHAAMRFTWDDNRLRHLQKAVELDSSYADAHAWLSLELRRSGDQEGAFLAVARAAELDPASVPANYNFVKYLIARGRLQEADEHIERFAFYCGHCAEHLKGLLASVGGNWADIILADLRFRSINRDGPRPWSAMDDLPWQLAMVGLVDEALRMAFPENEQLLQALDWETAAVWLRDRYPEPEQLDWSLHSKVYLWSYIGQYERALPAVEQMLQNRQAGERFRTVSYSDSYIAECFVAVLRHVGDELRVAEVLEELLDNARRYRSAGIKIAFWEDSVDYQEGVALYLLGDRARGVKLVAKAGGNGYWLPPPGKFQEMMYQEPEIEAALQIQAERQARERRRLLDVVCEDNPYPSIWRPMPETCAAHFSAIKD